MCAKPAPMEMANVDALIKKLTEHIKVLTEKIDENNREAAAHKKESLEFDEERT